MRNPHATSRPRGPRSGTGYDPAALIAAGRWSPEQQAKIRKVMEEFKAGTLESSDGSKVTNKRQALAIALSEAKSLTAAGRYDERKHRRKRKGQKGGGRFDRKERRDTTVDPEDVAALSDWTNPELDRMARTPAQRRAVGMRAAGTWDESKHPRDPGGEGGGQWTNSLESEQPSGDDGTAARDEYRKRREQARKQMEEMSGRAPTEKEISEALEEEDRLARGSDDDEDYQEFKTSGDKIMGWDEDQKTWMQVGTKQTDPDFYEEIAGAEGAEEDDGEVDTYATDYDEAGGDAVQKVPVGEAWGSQDEFDTHVQQVSDTIEDKIYESMDHAGEEEGYGDEASQGRGYGSQMDEEIAMAMEAYLDDEIGDMGISDDDYEKFSKAVEARLRKRMEGETASALTAAAAGLAPLVPPKSWFDKPALEEPTPITVTADGQVYGHAALWGTCHTGMSGVCRTPPRSESGYRFFHLGEVDTDDGPVHVGRVTMDTGHAPLTASREGTVRHYDHTGTGAAHVRAYEDEHGIVLAGALLPDLPAEKARRMKGATVSGDWRSIGGKLEMVGMLAVNVPGFPVPRAMAASLVVEDEPHTMALVAAGLYTERDPGSDERKLKALTARALGGVDGLVDAAMGGSKQKRRMGVTAAGRPFDPSKHPRHPGGSPEGGRWAKVTNTETGEVTYREGLASQVVKELREEGVDVGKIDSVVKVGPLPPGQTPEENARLLSGEPGFVQDTVEIQKHGLKYHGTIVKVTPSAAMVEYTTNNGKTKTVRVPHREYKVVEGARPTAESVKPDLGEQRLAEARKSRNWNPTLDVEPPDDIREMADRVDVSDTRWMTDHPGEVAGKLGMGREVAAKVHGELARRRRLDDIRKGKVVYTDFDI